MKLNVKRFLFFIGLAVVVLAVCFFRLPFQFQSSLNDLFPVQIDGKNLPKEVTDKYANILNVVIEAESFEVAKEKSDEFFNHLQTIGIKNITYQVPQNVLNQSLDYLKEYKSIFLSSDTERLLINSDTETVRKRAIQQIQTSWMPPLIPLQDDPFLLLTTYIKNMPKPVSSWSEKGGVLWQEKNNKNYILMFIKLDYDDIYKLCHDVHVIRKLSEENSNCQIHLSGAPIHTVQMFEETKKDISLISFGAILVLVILTYFLFYHIQSVLLVFLNLMIAFFCGTLSVFLFSSHVHFLTFAFGGCLIGICIDYSFHRFSYQKQDFSEELSKNIRYSFLTTIGCFVPLLFCGLPLLRQVSLFTIGGLLGTFIWIYISPIPTFKKLNVSSFQIRIPFKKGFLVCLMLISIIGISQININHTLQNLYKPVQSLQQEENFFHRLNGDTFSHILLIKGDHIQSVLEKEEKIKEKENFFSLSTLLPSLKKQKQRSELVHNLYSKELKRIQNELGFKNKPILKQTSFVDEKEFTYQFDFLIQQFIVKTSDGVWGVIPLSKPLVIADEDGMFFEPKKHLSNQLDLYALKSYQNLFICFFILLFILFIVYRKKAFKYIFPSLMGSFGTIGILSLFGESITFFHLLSLFVVIGLSMDYTIFLFSSQRLGKSVLFSFLSSFIGFGLLSFVHFYMVAVMGQTIALGLFLSFLMTLIIKKY